MDDTQRLFLFFFGLFVFVFVLIPTFVFFFCLCIFWYQHFFTTTVFVIPILFYFFVFFVGLFFHSCFLFLSFFMAICRNSQSHQHNQLLFGSFDFSDNHSRHYNLLFTFFSSSYSSMERIRLAFKAPSSHRGGSFSIPSYHLFRLHQSSCSSSQVLQIHVPHDHETFLYQFNADDQHQMILDRFRLLSMPPRLNRRPIHDEYFNLPQTDLQNIWIHRGSLPSAYHSEFLVRLNTRYTIYCS